MCEYTDEQTRYEHGNLPRESRVFSAEMIAIRALVDAIGSVVVVKEDNGLEIIETIDFNGE